MPIRVLFALIAVLLVFSQTQSASQTPGGPERVVIKSGPLELTALFWRSPGKGPFPAVTFNHGSYPTDVAFPIDDPARLASVFNRHGYALLCLFRQGLGPSNLVRYFGVFAPNARVRPRVVPAPAPLAPLAEAASCPVTPEPLRPRPPRRCIPWAERLKRTFQMDVLTCKRCGGRRCGTRTSLTETVSGHR